MSKGAGAYADKKRSQNKKGVRITGHLFSTFVAVAERGGFEPPVQLIPYVSLANWWFQPLTHLSKPSSDFETAKVGQFLENAKFL